MSNEPVPVKDIYLRQPDGSTDWIRTICGEVQWHQKNAPVVWLDENKKNASWAVEEIWMTPKEVELMQEAD